MYSMGNTVNDIVITLYDYVIYKNTKSLRCTHETNVTFYISYTSKQFFSSSSTARCYQFLEKSHAYFKCS